LWEAPTALHAAWIVTATTPVVALRFMRQLGPGSSQGSGLMLPLLLLLL
jgi:hypothetical protein